MCSNQLSYSGFKERFVSFDGCKYTAFFQTSKIFDVFFLKKCIFVWN